MPDEKHHYEALPIPTYEEAIGSSSRTSTPSHSAEPASVSEREGLLGPGSSARLPVPTRRAGYRPPSTEDGHSNRGSLDQEHDTFLSQNDERRWSNDTEEASVRAEMEEMEIQEPPAPLSAWGKRISSLSQSLSSINLPFNWKFPKLKFGWPKIDANFCIVLGRCFAVVLVMAVVYVLFMSDLFPGPGGRGQMFDPESVRQHVQHQVDVNRIREQLQKITQNDHLAGTEGDYVLAKYVHDFFVNSGLEEVRMDEFEVYLNYPKEGGRRVELLAPGSEEAKWSAKIEEDSIYSDPPRQETPVFHGHSRSGDVTGPLLYANYGSRQDYKVFYDSGIDTKGAIALVRHGGNQADIALKVKAAEDVGFIGCIIYNDPADDGFVKGNVAPAGNFIPESAAQRGSVTLGSLVIGDPLTPGHASVQGAPRISPNHNPALVNIPSVPLSWGDAKHLLHALQGVGSIAPENWKGGVPDVEYWVGDATSPRVHLVNDQDEVHQQSIWNVMGKIKGMEQGEKSIIIGNHRDAWVYGASDPGSGTAVMMEVVTIFGDLLARGWRPLRTIEFASWDAGAFNSIGSTEYVEANVEQLRQDAFVYLNVDSGVSGNEFVASGSPVFKKSLLRALDRTSDLQRNGSLRELWDQRNGQLDGPGGGSDFVPFQSIAGTSSLDFKFVGSSPRHSAFDNFEFVDTVIDPGFQYHGILAQVWSLLILEFCDRLVLPFDFSAYSSSVTQWAMDLETWTENKGLNQAGNAKWNIEPLREAVLEFNKDAQLFEKWEVEWNAIVLGGNGFESAILAAHRRSHNTRMANFETHLLDLEDGGGIPNRTQFKHILFAPQLWSTYEASIFPAIRDAVEAGQWELAQQQVEKVASILTKASKKLLG